MGRLSAAEASRSCTPGWPGLKHKLPASVQPSAPCHGVTGDIWLSLLQLEDGLEQGSAVAGWTLPLPAAACRLGWAAVPGLLGLS